MYQYGCRARQFAYCGGLPLKPLQGGPAPNHARREAEFGFSEGRRSEKRSTLPVPLGLS
jgi:hypothetical protein